MVEVTNLADTRYCAHIGDGTCLLIFALYELLEVGEQDFFGDFDFRYTDRLFAKKGEY